MRAAESEAWKCLCAKREKCLAFLEISTAPVGDPLLCEVADIERLVSDLWVRLEANTRKGTTVPTEQQGTSLAHRWVNQVVIPLSLAWSLCEEQET